MWLSERRRAPSQDTHCYATRSKRVTEDADGMRRRCYATRRFYPAGPTMPRLLPARAPLAVAVLATALLCGACATVQTTESGAIGLERKQYFAEGSREAVRGAAESYYDEHLEAAMAEFDVRHNAARPPGTPRRPQRLPGRADLG